jgi:hypothetical protein
MARHVHRDRQGGLVILALNDRKAQFALGYALDIVPRQPQLAFDRANFLAKLLAKVLDERLHYLVVEHLSELGLIPSLMKLLGMGQ